MFFFAPGPCPSTAGRLRLSSLFLPTRPCGPRIPSPSVPFLRVWALPRMPLGPQDGAQPESRTPGTGCNGPGPSPSLPRARLPLPCESLLPRNLEKGTEIKLGWVSDLSLGCGRGVGVGAHPWAPRAPDRHSHPHRLVIIHLKHL